MELKQRMYNITSFYMTGLPCGIQSYHAGMEYAALYWNTPEFRQWIKTDKTVIILAGGDSNAGDENHENTGSMEKMRDLLIINHIKIGIFYEPGINDALTSISFLVDENVWDKEKYPDPVHVYTTETKEEMDLFTQISLNKMYGEKTAFLRMFLKNYNLAK